MKELMSLIADQKRKGNITDVQAKELQKYAASLYLGWYLQTTVQSYIDKFGKKISQRPQNKFDGLAEQIGR